MSNHAMLLDTTHKQLGIMSNHAMRLDTNPMCMWYHSSPRSLPHDATKIS